MSFRDCNTSAIADGHISQDAGAEFLLLIAQRTQADEPATAVYDPDCVKTQNLLSMLMGERRCRGRPRLTPTEREICLLS